MFIIAIFLLIHFFEKETKIALCAIFVSFIKKDDQKTVGFLISFFLKMQHKLPQAICVALINKY